MFGLFSFFYVTLHFLTYIWLDKFFDMHEMLVDIAKRKFITVGWSKRMSASRCNTRLYCHCCWDIAW
jgi:hypothetical protein